MEDYKEITMNSYNKSAKLFAEKFKDLSVFDQRDEFSKMIELCNGKKILDLGCGGGEHAFYFKNKGFDVTCVDLSEEMVKMCKEKELNVLQMDIEDLKFEDNSFDAVWAVTSLLHVPKNKMRNVAKKLSEIIKSKGILVVIIKEGDGEKIAFDEVDKNIGRFFSYWKKEEFIQHFKDYFDLIDFDRKMQRDRVFLHFFFRNKK